MELEAAFDVTIPDDEFVTARTCSFARSARFASHAGNQMTRRISVKLAAPANDMVQEEIIKQVAFLSVDLRNPAFSGVRRHTRMRSPFRAGRRADAADSGAREARAGESPAPRAQGRVQQSRRRAVRRVPSRTSFQACTFWDWARRRSTASRCVCSGTSIERSRRSARRGRPSLC